MDIIGYVFLGIAVIALISGLAKGLVSTLLSILSVVGSVAVAILLTPTVSEMDAIKNLIEDTPIVINGQEMFYLRTVIVFFALFLLALLALLALKGLLNALLKRVKVLKFIDRIVGAIFSVAVVWAVFGIVFAISSAGTEWLVEIDNQLATSGINLGLAQIVGNAMQSFNNSQILQMVYSTFNPVGDLVGNILLG